MAKCEICGAKIGGFGGRLQAPHEYYERAKKVQVELPESICTACAQEKIKPAEKKLEHEQYCEQNAEQIEYSKKIAGIFATPAAIPDDFQDLGLVTGYCIMGTGPLSTIASLGTDFLGEESNAYLKKVNKAENFAILRAKKKAYDLGATAIYNLRLGLAEAATGHGMLMISVSGSAARKNEKIHNLTGGDMRRILCFLGLAIALLTGAGCSTKSSYEAINPEVQIPKTAKYEIIEIKDLTGFSPSGEDVDPAKAMRTALEAELSKAGLSGNEYKLKVELSEYEPGNAFARWLLPGVGGTYLKTKTIVLNPDNSIIAVIPVNRTVAAGGAFTIGAWRECFNEAAAEIVNVLKREMGLTPKKNQTSEEQAKTSS